MKKKIKKKNIILWYDLVDPDDKVIKKIIPLYTGSHAKSWSPTVMRN